MREPYRVDPPGCGCTECITGESVPLDQASAEQIRQLAVGALEDATSRELAYTLTVAADGMAEVRFQLTPGQADAALHHPARRSP